MRLQPVQPGGLSWRSDIDGLRALAVAAVVLFHGFPTLLPGGYLGVDVFFVLSGYLITAILLRDISDGRLHLGRFLARRARRILPVLVLVLVASWLAAWSILLPDEFATFGRHMAAGAGFVANFAYLQEVGYFDISAESKPLLHLWSLAIEEQFYLIWPFALWLFCRSGRQVLIPVALAGGLSFLFDFGAARIDPVTTFYLPHARAWELLTGAMLSLAQSCRRATERADTRSIRDVSAVAGLGTLLAVFITSGERVGHDTTASLTAVAGALLLLTAGPAAGLNRVLLSHPLVVWLGLVSYSLYLWHWPMLSMLRILAGGEAPVSFRVAAILGALALAAVTFYGLERPIRRAPPSAWLVGALLGALAVTGWLGWYTAETGGLPTRVPQLQTYAKELDRSADRIPACSAGQRLPCAPQLAERPRQALLVGDSHMHSLLAGFVALADSGELGFGLRASGRGGCAPFLGVETFTPQSVAYGCRSLVPPSILDAATDPRVVWVLLIGRHAARVAGALPVTSRKPIWHTSPWRFEYEGPEGRSFDASQAFSLGLAATVKTLTAAGKHVLFVHQLPELDFDPRQCLRPLAVSWDAGNCSIDRAAVVARQKAYRQVARRVLAEFPQVLQYDPMDLVCDSRQCSPFASTGEMLYRDDNHLSVTGARRMAEELVLRMEALDGGRRTAVRP